MASFGFDCDFECGREAVKLSRAAARAKGLSLKRAAYERSKDVPRNRNVLECVKPHSMKRAAARTCLARGTVEANEDMPSINGMSSGARIQRRKPSVAPLVCYTKAQEERREDREVEAPCCGLKEEADIHAYIEYATTADGSSNAADSPQESPASFVCDTPEEMASLLDALPALPEPASAPEADDDAAAEAGLKPSAFARWAAAQAEAEALVQRGLEEASKARQRAEVEARVIKARAEMEAQEMRAALEVEKKAQEEKAKARAEAEAKARAEEEEKARKEEEEKAQAAKAEAQKQAAAALKRAKELEQQRAKQQRKQAEQERRLEAQKQREAEIARKQAEMERMAARAQAAAEADAVRAKAQAEARKIQEKAREVAKAKAEEAAAAKKAAQAAADEIKAKAEVEAKILREHLEREQMRAKAEFEALRVEAAAAKAAAAEAAKKEEEEGDWEVLDQDLQLPVEEVGWSVIP